MGADQGKAMIASCSREATTRPSTSISTSTIARSPLRRWNRSTTTAWTSATAVAGANPWWRINGPQVDPRAAHEVGGNDVVRQGRPHRRMDDTLAAVDVEIVAHPLAVIGAPAITQLDPPRRQRGAGATGGRRSALCNGAQRGPRRFPVTAPRRDDNGLAVDDRGARHVVVIEDRRVEAHLATAAGDPVDSPRGHDRMGQVGVRRHAGDQRRRKSGRAERRRRCGSGCRRAPAGCAPARSTSPARRACSHTNRSP